MPRAAGCRLARNQPSIGVELLEHNSPPELAFARTSFLAMFVPRQNRARRQGQHREVRTSSRRRNVRWKMRGARHASQLHPVTTRLPPMGAGPVRGGTGSASAGGARSLVRGSSVSTATPTRHRGSHSGSAQLINAVPGADPSVGRRRLTLVLRVGFHIPPESRS